MTTIQTAEAKRLQRALRRHKISVMRSLGYSINDIVKITKEHRSFVTDWIRKSKEGQGFSDLPRSGRPCKVPVEVVVAAIEAQPAMSSKQIAQTIQEQQHVTIHPTTVQRAAKKKGLYPYVRPSKPLLTDRHKAKRVAFAKEERRAEFRTILFTDECDIQLGKAPNRNQNRYWATNRNDVPSWPTQKHAAKFKVWGGISYHGKTELVFYDGLLNAKAYQEKILSQSLRRDQMARIFGRRKWRLMQDGAPPHTAKSTTDWLRQKGVSHISGGKTGKWPAQSPDLNPIENLWAIVKNRVYKTQPRTVSELKERILAVWNSITLDELKSLTSSYPKRLRMVVKLKGETLPN